MLRLRLLRFSLLALLLLLGALLFREFKPRRTVHTAPSSNEAAGEPGAEDITFFEYKGPSRSLVADADLVRPGADGRLHFEGLRRLEIEREGGTPLVVSASEGDVQGNPGQRAWHLQEQVVVRDPEEGLELQLPSLVIEESAGEARSEGEIHFTGPAMSGRASSLTYDLRGRPAVLLEPELEDQEGGRITASRALLLDGMRDIELREDVRVTRGVLSLSAARVRLLRPQNRLERAEASGGVSGTHAQPSGPPVRLDARDLEVQWDAAGDIQRLTLVGRASVRHGVESLSGETVELRPVPGGGWDVTSRQDVVVQGPFENRSASLRAESLEAVLDPRFALRSAHAAGGVSFEGPETQAESERASYSADTGGGDVQLFGNGVRKARLARGRTRVAADWIRTVPSGLTLLADGRVEATLLPGERGVAPAAGLFEVDEAVHFVSSKLEGAGGGTLLVFNGSVRAWQGDRNLAGERIEIDQRTHAVTAEREVTTRIPRETAAPAVREADYIQIGADRLDYDEHARKATYRGAVTLRLAEGWLEAERVEIELEPTTQRVREVRAFDAVRLEFQQFRERDAARAIGGKADRVVYVPAQAAVWLYGSRTPAEVRRLGEAGGGTTTGRVLRYRLDLGTLEVESGDQGPARIQTSGAPGT